MPSKTSRVLLAACILASLVPAGTGLGAQKKGGRGREPKAAPLDYAKSEVVLKTTQGDLTIQLFHDKAPKNVQQFVDLARTGVYNGTLFHRAVPNFVLQGGDPLTKDPAKSRFYGVGTAVDKNGTPVYVKAEFNESPSRRGAVVMAHMLSDPDSASSQFFIVLKDSPALDRQWTVIGQVTNGMDVVDKLVQQSDPDTSDQRTGGLPRSYQRILSASVRPVTP